ncbi:transporter [Flagellimonas flava]|uniref:Putative MetA-pathway of phenol degradation n=1 Tax=Flagellimonas flava TaxID=570519 RepID=A0A1M5NLC0_9FLAO|nr:transporter [Allomuricauda flava]SHG89989.1 Putative MetA-pathway of phenol degradation [Allomuricauda flava]
MKKAITLFLVIISSANLFAQIDGPRTYAAVPKNLNILSAHFISAQANASINNLSFINPDATVESNLYMLTYTRSQPIFGRTFYSTLIMPAGNLTATLDVDAPGPVGSSNTIFQHGFGDLTWLNTINLIGAKGLMIKDFVRHESPSLLYFQAGLTFPIGQYESDEAVNIGSNQFKLKLGLPFIQRIGPWIDGKKTTLELFPAYTLISNNNDFQGQEVQQKGLFTLEGHLTRDITNKSYLSLDYSYINGGDSEFFLNETGALVNEQAGQNVHLIGASLGFNINDNLNLTMTHNQSFSSGNDNVSLDGTLTKITLSWSFHDFQNKFKNYIESN